MAPIGGRSGCHGSRALARRYLFELKVAPPDRCLVPCSDELSPLNSRMRVRLALERATPDELTELLVHALQKAGAVKLMTPELIATLADHAQGNPRALMNIAGELLDVAAQREAHHIDEKLFLEMCATPPLPEPKTARPRR